MTQTAVFGWAVFGQMVFGDVSGLYPPMVIPVKLQRKITANTGVQRKITINCTLPPGISG